MNEDTNFTSHQEKTPEPFLDDYLEKDYKDLTLEEAQEIIKEWKKAYLDQKKENSELKKKIEGLNFLEEKMEILQNKVSASFQIEEKFSGYQETTDRKINKNLEKFDKKLLILLAFLGLTSFGGIWFLYNKIYNASYNLITQNIKKEFNQPYLQKMVGDAAKIYTEKKSESIIRENVNRTFDPFEKKVFEKLSLLENDLNKKEKDLDSRLSQINNSLNTSSKNLNILSTGLLVTTKDYYLLEQNIKNITNIKRHSAAALAGSMDSYLSLYKIINDQALSEITRNSALGEIEILNINLSNFLYSKGITFSRAWLKQGKNVSSSKLTYEDFILIFNDQKVSPQDLKGLIPFLIKLQKKDFLLLSQSVFKQRKSLFGSFIIWEILREKYNLRFEFQKMDENLDFVTKLK